MIVPSSREQHRIAQAHVAKQLELTRKQGFQRCVDVGAVEQDLAHVADVEQAGILTHPKVLGHDAFVLDGHFIAGERDHPAALAAMPFVKG